MKTVFSDNNGIVPDFEMDFPKDGVLFLDCEAMYSHVTPFWEAVGDLLDFCNHYNFYIDGYGISLMLRDFGYTEDKVTDDILDALAEALDEYNDGRGDDELTRSAIMHAAEALTGEEWEYWELDCPYFCGDGDSLRDCIASAVVIAPARELDEKDVERIEREFYKPVYNAMK